jgi:putative ABC transport system permease protein
MDNLFQDIRYGMRSLFRAPAFMITAVLALGLGIGAVTAIFSVLDGIVLRPLPFKDPGRLVMLWETNVSKSLDHEPISPVNFVDYRSLSQSFSDATAWWRPDFTLTDEDSEPLHVHAIEALSNFFTVLGVEPQMGRGFPAGPLFSSASEIVISHRLWRNRFHGDPNIVGRSVRLNGRPFSVVGVMASAFTFPDETDIWQLQQWDPARHSRQAHFMESVARIAPDVPIERAQSDLTALTLRLQKDYASSNREWSARAIPVLNEVVGYFRPALYVLMAAVSLLLLIACINVANLMLARAAAREREVAIRSAIGATRERLVRQFLTESVLLAVMGATLGVVLAGLAVKGLTIGTPIPIPRLNEVAVDSRVLVFAIAVTGLTALIFGFLPSTLMSRTDLQNTLKEGSRGSAGALRARTRHLLVVSEVALAVMVLVGAGLLIRTVGRLVGEKSGFRSERVMTASVQIPAARYTTYNDVDRFYSQLLSALRERSDVMSVGMTNVLPLDNGWRVAFLVPGESASLADEQRMVQYHSVSEGYFQAIGVPVLRGRDFDERDTPDNPGVVIVNEAFVRRYFPTEDPVGKTIISVPINIGPLGSSLMKDRAHMIVGVVGDVKNQTLRGTVEPSIFHSARQFPFRTMHIMIRARSDQPAITSILRDTVHRLDSAMALADIRPLDNIVQREVEQPRFLMYLMAGFATLAMALATLGIYGVLSYAVTQRQQEISIRMALGAAPGSVLGLIVWQGLRLTLAGALIGIVGALVFGRYLSTVLYGVTLSDPLTLGGVILSIFTVAFVACWIPARRAASIDPLSGLRAE